MMILEQVWGYDFDPGPMSLRHVSADFGTKLIMTVNIDCSTLYAE